MSRSLAVLAALFLFLLLVPVAHAAEGDEDCLECHSSKDALADMVADESRLASLVIDPERYGRQVHQQGCLECHFDYEEFPHPEEGESATCLDCHEEAGQAVKAGPHGEKRSDEELIASCLACHGVHDILRAGERDSRLYPLNVHLTCGACHFENDPSVESREALSREHYLADSHGHGLLQQGLVVSATCVSCHGGHDVRRKGDPDSPLARTRVADACGVCHRGATEEYKLSVHYLKGAADGQKGATCTDCHRPHEITQETASFREQSLTICSSCHEERGGSFRLSYHGKRTLVGFQGDVATCGDCHSNHRILPESDPESTVHENNVVATCGKCHEGSHAGFASYRVHLDPRDPEDSQAIHVIWLVMRTLLFVVLAVGVAHVILWLVRATVAGDWKRPKVKHEEMRHFRRWPAIYVFYHLVVMTSVLMLASTGLPLHFADHDWARRFMNFFGGAAAAGYVHRVFAVALVMLVAVFVSHLAYRLVVKRERGLFHGPNSMLPRVKDAQDIWGNLRWFLFLGPRPRYDRWTYWEKFDFWAVFWGTFVIGVSGLMLWFPVQATRIVPGWFLNAAVVIHGIEAILDVAFIMTVHVFHANLRPDKFPIDPIFYTGRIDEHEYRADRPLEYERALQTGDLERQLARTPRHRTRIIAYIIGSLAMAVGFFFLAAMAVALISR